jgi:phosphoribosylglycinamide formyltransferase-1
MHAVRDAQAHGVKVSGCTVHFVTEAVDEGPIVLQRCVAVLEDDSEESLHARIREQEHVALPEAVALFAAGRLRLEGRRVHVVPASAGAAR